MLNFMPTAHTLYSWISSPETRHSLPSVHFNMLKHVFYNIHEDGYIEKTYCNVLQILTQHLAKNKKIISSH